MRGVPVAIVPTVLNVPDVPIVPNVTSVPIVPNSFSCPPEQGKRAGRDRHNGRDGLCGAAAFIQHLRSVSAAYTLRIPGVWLVCSPILKALGRGYCAMASRMPRSSSRMRGAAKISISSRRADRSRKDAMSGCSTTCMP